MTSLRGWEGIEDAHRDHLDFHMAAPVTLPRDAKIKIARLSPRKAKPVKVTLDARRRISSFHRYHSIKHRKLRKLSEDLFYF